MIDHEGYCSAEEVHQQYQIMLDENDEPCLMIVTICPECGKFESKDFAQHKREESN